MSSLKISSAASPRSLAWIPWLFVAALGLVIAVNGALVYFALHSWSGLSTERPYERGLAYNQVLAAVERQEAAGWRLEIAFAPGTAEPRAGVLVVSAVDRDGRGIADLAVEAELRRPLERGAPMMLPLAAAGPGRYTGPLVLARPGQWDVHISAGKDGFVYQTSRRIIVP
jgi:nitrogen fixation protein FixH